MVAIREQFREKLGNEDFIEISFLYGSNSMSLGFMFFNEMGQLVIVTKRLHYKEDAPYESRNRIADTLSAALWVGVNNAVLYGEIGSKGLNRPLNYDFVYNMFGY